MLDYGYKQIIDNGSATLILYTIYTTYRELEGAVSIDSDSKDPLLTDVNNKFISCMEQFQKSTKVNILCVCVCVLLLLCVCTCVRVCALCVCMCVCAYVCMCVCTNTICT